MEISDLCSMPTEMLHKETCHIINAYCYTRLCNSETDFKDVLLLMSQ